MAEQQLSGFKLWRENQRKKRAEEEARYAKMTSTQKAISFAKTLFNALVLVTILNGILIASFVVPTGSMEDTVLTGEYLFVNKFIFGPSTPQIIPIINLPLPFYKMPPIRKPQQGDVIVFIFPGERDKEKADEFTYYLKRCIAVAGDTLQVVNDTAVYVNGVRFPLPRYGKYIPEPMTTDDSFRTFPIGKGYTRANYGPIRIPQKGDVIQLNQTNIVEWATFIRREGHTVDFNNSSVIIDGKAVTSFTVGRDYVFGMGDNRNNSLDSRYFGFIAEEDVVGTPLVVYFSWEINDAFGNPTNSFFKRLTNIRWSRLGTVIR
jgi:signal peptidase I